MSVSNVILQRSKEDGLPQQHPTSVTSIDFSNIPPPPDLTPYIIKIGDDYVAGGSFGDVYRCRYLHGSTSQEVAVKALRVKFSLDGDPKDKSIELVRRELGIWKRLRHNNVVPFLGTAYGFGMSGAMSLVSLWMPNDTLHKFLATHDSKLDVVHRLQILLDIAKGLGHLHSFQVIHGDLNSNNVLLDADYVARLADFGYASLVGNIPEALDYLQRSTARPGAWRWIAPEQTDFERPFIRTTESDIYSFGCIALEVLSGKQPWSEVRQDTAVVLRLHLGYKPDRPVSRAIDDSHWDFIQRCWSPLQERPTADIIILFMQRFLSDHPPCGPLRNLFISLSSQAQEPLVGSSLSLGAARQPLLLGTATSLLSSPNSPSLATNFHPLPASDVASSTLYSTNLLGSSIPDDSAAHGITSDADYYSPIEENDIIIVVMGPTGAGKSSFVNKAAGKMEVVMGHDMKSQTRKVQPVRCLHPDGRRNIVLLDAPGFDDTYLSDTQILRIIANWLKETYQNNVKLAGILYLHRISDVRLAGTPLRNLAVFKDLCGDSNLKNIILVTTMWDEIEDQSVGSKREEELRSTYWKDMIHLGSDTCRFQGTRESAWEIIDRLNLEGPRRTRIPLQIQREMVDRRLPLHETAAAKILLRFLVAELKKVWARLRNGVRGTFGARVRPTASQGRPLSRSSTIGSGTSDNASSVALTSASSNSSHSSPLPPSPDSTSSGCTANGHREALLATITGLRLAHQMADIASIPMLRGAIGTVLHIAQLIQGMGGTHHAICQVIEYSGWLLEEITQYAAGSELSKDMKKTLSSFQKELKQLQNVVKISKRGHIARFFLHDADIHAVAACTAAIKAIYDKPEIRLAIDNRQAIARLQDHLKTLYDDGAGNANVEGWSWKMDGLRQVKSRDHYCVDFQVVNPMSFKCYL